MKNIVRLDFVFLLGLIRTCLSDPGTLVNVGCFDLSYALRMNYHRHVPGVSLGDCVNLCSFSGAKYAGIERSDNFCYCGGDIAEESLKREDPLCNVECPDYKNQKCGGDWLMSLYDISGEPRLTTTTQAPLNTKDNVGFLIGSSVGVSLYNTSSINSPSTVMPLADWAYAVDYHWERNLAFAFSRKRIIRSSLLDRKATPTIIREATGCDGFAVDWVHDRIYWAECRGNVTILSMDLDGKNVAVVMARPGPAAGVRRMEIDPYKQVLFWVADGVIESCSLSGAQFRSNMSAPGVVTRSMALDLGAQRVYYTAMLNSSSTLYSMNYRGGETRMIFSLPVVKSVYGMGLVHGILYWVNYANTRDIVYKTTLNASTIREVTVIKQIEKPVWHMKVVHPQLQTKPFSPCDDKGCSHSCVVLGLLPVCECPKGLRLTTDGTTCLGYASERLVSEKRSLSPAMIALCVFFAVVVILVASGLLFFKDRYWPSLQARLSAVPYKREEGSERTINPQFDTTADNVNLI